MKVNNLFWLCSLLIMLLLSTACSANSNSNAIPEASSVADVESEDECLPLAPDKFAFLDSQKKELLTETEFNKLLKIKAVI